MMSVADGSTTGAPALRKNREGAGDLSANTAEFTNVLKLSDLSLVLITSC